MLIVCTISVLISTYGVFCGLRHRLPLTAPFFFSCLILLIYLSACIIQLRCGFLSFPICAILCRAYNGALVYLAHNIGHFLSVTLPRRTWLTQQLDCGPTLPTVMSRMLEKQTRNYICLAMKELTLGKTRLANPLNALAWNWVVVWPALSAAKVYWLYSFPETINTHITTPLFEYHTKSCTLFRAVFLNHQAAARYRALASSIPGCQNLSF